MKKVISYSFVTAVSFLLTLAVSGQDPLADNMLLYQRNIGGWPKHINDVKVDYTKELTPAQKSGILDDKFRNDATIDNGATSKEIRHLIKAYQKTNNKEYLAAAENGIRYLLTMQYANGGFPQFYPDTNLYRSQITFNDNAMINVLNILREVAQKKNGFELVNATLPLAAGKAVEKGIDCILKTQIKVKGKLTGWCAQHDRKTLQPVKARSFELVSISGMETVGILEFLMKVENPSEEIKKAITAGVDWLEKSKINGFKYQDVEDATKPKGKDRVLLPDAASMVWARFYDVDTNQPFFCGRDGVKRWSLTEIDHERRIGYAWYGTWPADLLKKDYPAWRKKNGLA